jgi:hypothetical protein
MDETKMRLHNKERRILVEEGWALFVTTSSLGGCYS